MSTHILVVDDEPDVEALVVQRFRRQIRKGEMTFLFAHDGQQALDLVRNEPDIDMVLSDINMPRMDGLTLLDKLRDLRVDLRTVIVSAYGDMANIRIAMNRGAFDFITKPIEFEDLEVTIQKTLDHIEMLRCLDAQRRAAEQVQATLSRYFSPNVALALAENPDLLSAGGERRFVTFLFTDLADFTTLVEASDPDVIVTLLNEYLVEVTQIVFDHGGTVMKLVGDAVHVMFGAPVEQDDHCQRAVSCALAIDAFTSQFKARKNSDGLAIGDTRIGAHAGTAIIGNFGGENFFDYTAHGDAVNVASRLEGANKYFGTRICVSEVVAQNFVGFKGRPIGRLLLKGKTQPIETFEPLTDETFDQPVTQAYLEAYKKLQERNPDAGQAFAALVGQYGQDPLSTFHLRRALAGECTDEITLADK